MLDTEDWPYDADRDDPLTALRIPVVSAYGHEFNYIVMFDRDSAQRPTDAEAAMLAPYLGHYVDHWYTDTWKARLAERPFDVDGGANGVVFHKYGPDDWGYRRRSWTMGPKFVPSLDRKEPSSLERVMDRVHTVLDEPMPDWLEWKAARPEVFGRVEHA